MDERFAKLSKPFEKSAYKDVNFGRTFTSIDAYHIIERLTEVFGLCGEGWGFGELKFERLENSVACIGSIWYGKDRASVHAVGDAQVIKNNLAEAYKKAQTNLISKAASFIGVGLSVYKGQGIDCPYRDRESENKVNKRQQQREPQEHYYNFRTMDQNGLTWVYENIASKGVEVSEGIWCFESKFDSTKLNKFYVGTEVSPELLD